MFLWAVQLAALRNNCLAHFSPQSVFQTLIAVFCHRTVVQSRTFLSFGNQHFTIIQLFEHHNGSKFFVLGLHYPKEIALDSVPFIERKGGNRWCACTYLFTYLCFIYTSSHQVTIVSSLKMNLLQVFHLHD